MKLFRIEDEEDLWCEYGSAYEAILNLMSSSFPDQAKSKWALDKAYVNWRGDSYTVNATFTRFDEAVRDVVMLKALMDALFDDDSCVWDCRITKLWGEKGQIIIGEIK